MTNHHDSVLLEPAISGLAIQPHGIYIDATFGRGGHSKEILRHLAQDGRLIAIDRDPQAIDYARNQFKDNRFEIHHRSFQELKNLVEQLNLSGKIQGILFDFGLSSPQIDDPKRGFSFLQEGPLDMRMNTLDSIDAASFIQNASEKTMADVFFQYGEERYSRRIARAIVQARTEQPITTTTQLAEIVKQANPNWEKHKHPATRVFQAIRIHINQELEAIREALDAAFASLAPNGRLVVISFHSLEDRMVKQFMKLKEQGEPLPHRLPILAKDCIKVFRRVGKAIKPTPEEIQRNVRARSAILRIGEKLS